ncbi:MAG: DNA gyrase modulator, partial [Bdellovibrionota bacterium]
MISPSLAEKVLKATLRNGGELAEVFVERRSGTRLLLEESRIEEAASAAEQGIGIRLVRDRREVYGYSNDFSPEKLLEIAAFLAQSAR